MKSLTQQLGTPSPVSTAIAVELLNLLETAKQHIPSDVPLNQQDPSTQSLVYQRMLELTKEKGEILKSCQAWIVVQLARSGVWMAHPDGYSSIRQFLFASGMNKTEVSLLAGLAEKVVPFCDAQEIEIDPLLTDEHWGQLREGLAAAKAAVDAEDTDTILELFDDVKQAPGRDVIRSKWQQHRTVLGHGASWKIDDQQVFIIVAGDSDSSTNSSDGADAIRNNLRGKVKWDLVIYEKNGRLKIATQEN